MYNLITIKFYTKPFSLFLQRNGTYFLNKPRLMTGVEALYFVSLKDNLLSVLRGLLQPSLLLVFLCVLYSFFLSQSDLFYIIIVDVEGYFCT